jgi:hypothetical protein
MKSNKTQSLTQVCTDVIKKGKNTLYLILRPKPLPEKIIDDLKEEVEKRFLAFINSKRDLLESINPENPEKFYECFFLKAMINVLEKMLEEKKISLSERDKNTLKELFEKESQKKDDLEEDKSNHNK